MDEEDLFEVDDLDEITWMLMQLTRLEEERQAEEKIDDNEELWI